MRLWFTGALLLAISMLLPAAAMAATETEPNNGIHQANGPLVADVNYDGTLSGSGEDDWYILYVSGQGLLDVSILNIDDSSNCSPDLRLLDTDGKQLNHVEPSETNTEDIPYNTPGAATYYLSVSESCPGDKYRLKATGPLTTGPTPGPAEPTTNGHTSVETALGPLLGDTLYGGSIDASDEEDWFFFYVSGPGAFDVAITNINDSSNCHPDLRLYDAAGKQLNHVEPAENQIEHISYTSSAAEKFVLQVSESCPVDQYQFVITPGSLLTSVPPPVAKAKSKPATSKACKKARTKKKKALKMLALGRARYGAAINRRQRRHWRRVVKKRRAAVRKAARKAKTVCA